MRTIRVFATAIGYIIYLMPFLRKVKATAKEDYQVREYDEFVHQYARNFSRKVMKASGSKVVISGEENLPESSFLLVSNHQANFDIITLLGYFNRPFGFVAKVELKRLPVVRSWMSEMGCLFLDRKDRRQSLKTFKEGIQLLKDGHHLAIFPEGTRSKGREMNDFKSGSFSLAKKANVPVVPVMIDGTYEIMEANGGKMKPSTVHLTICAPIEPSDYETMTLEEISKETRHRIEQAQRNLKETRSYQVI
ncbi:lysophospholipid acyltransferase family protein [Halalkalibacillus halophilus]|uniref:lysophospholipid acyltransferase family protein n=1 Tax=Halalkalibacillus halophilus TaxID=392827 RepID=UPI0004022D86|nr:lysophospholipid acyltransferase family protein [Halalkalibacillus halophilus]